MPDYQNFSITRNGSVTGGIPRYTITCNVVNSTSGALIRNFAVSFPGVLSQFTDDELDEAFKDLIMKLIEIRLRRQ